MHPFDFIILFFSFIYTLALTHLLFAATRMIRHRRQLVFSWPHGLWMALSMLLLCENWLSLWDLHDQEQLSLEAIATTFVMVISQYFTSALVAPDFEGGDSYDLREFHTRERRTYVGTLVVVGVIGVCINLEGALRLGLSSWGQQNWIALPFLALTSAALVFDRPVVQIGAPLILIAILLTYPVLYYPVLS